MSRVVLAGLVVCALAATAFAQPMYLIQQQRELSVDIWDETGYSISDSKSAPSLDPWQAEVVVRYDPTESRTGSAGQTSGLAGGTLEAYGAADVFMDVEWAEPELHRFAHGLDRYRIRFAIVEESQYDLTGYLYVDAYENGLNSDANLTLTLRRIADSSLYEKAVHSSYWPDSAVVATSGLLSPGVYELDVTAVMYCEGYWGDGMAEGGFGVYLDVTPEIFEPTCDLPLDSDGDGDIDMSDFAQMQQCYTGPQP